VHKAMLKDGREVAVKIQYPGIDRVIKSDLKNLRVLFRLLLSNILKVDMHEIWTELKLRLMEELDYHRERRNQEEFIELFKDHDEIIIPKTVPEAPGHSVLTTELLTGHDSGAFDSGVFSQDMRNHFGQTLYRIFLIQLMRFRVLHSDPNLANFAFLPDGRIIIYDFGNVKRVPAPLADNYFEFCLALFQDRNGDLPDILRRMGVHHADGRAVESGQMEEFIEICRPIFTEKPYCFGHAEAIFDQIIQMKTRHWMDSLDIVFPRDIIFIHRALGGLFGNLNRIQACGNWGEIAREALIGRD